MEQRIDQEQEITGSSTSGATAFQPSAVASRSSVRLIPNVLKRLFLFVSSVDNVNCHAVHWLVRSIACSQLYVSIVEPKNGVFLLKWPLCFHNREDSYHCHRQFWYLDLIRYNVSLKTPPSEIVNQMQLFLAGYEKMLLDVVHASAVNLYYNDLQTLIIDLSMYDQESMCMLEQTFPLKRKAPECDGTIVEHKDDDNEVVHDDWCYVTHEIFLGSWHQWAQAITAITDSCGATLSHFVFTTDSFARSYSYLSYNQVRLPAQLYRALNFDKMLSEMRNLRTLYLPIHGYNNAFHEKPEVGMDLDLVWPIVRSLPRGELLPLLQRVVTLEGGFKFSRPNGNMSGGYTFSNMPLASSNVIMECLTDLKPDIEREVEDFLRALTFVTRFHTKIVITPLRMHCSYNLVLPYVGGDPPLNHADEFDDDEDGMSAQTISDKLSQFVESEALVCERQLKLSVWNDTARSFRSDNVMPAAQKPVIVVQIADICKKIPDKLQNSSLHVTETLETLVDMLLTRRIRPSAVQIIIEEIHLRHKNGWGWGLMHQVLPFFAVGSAAAIVDATVLDAFRLNMEMGRNFSTFGAKVKSWYSKARKTRIGRKKMFCQQYRFPGIYLTICDTILYAEDDIESQSADVWVEAIERVMRTKIGLLLRDAVDSCTRRDMSYNLYQSVKRIEYEFEVFLDVCEELFDQVTLLLQSRAATFERRVVDEVFAEMPEMDAANQCEQTIMFWRLAGLVRHKVAKIN